MENRCGLSPSGIDITVLRSEAKQGPWRSEKQLEATCASTECPVRGKIILSAEEEFGQTPREVRTAVMRQATIKGQLRSSLMISKALCPLNSTASQENA